MYAIYQPPTAIPAALAHRLLTLRPLNVAFNDLYRLKIKAIATAGAIDDGARSPPALPLKPSRRSFGVMSSFVSALQYFPGLGFDAFLILTILQV
ncbi:hypothetical protein L6452_27103 [Arctium lappa]|uniref:Uncharacterized protein n=1 Tax=Arctium lappa TaxID=4217 RepID=A0ACB8ZWS9_ARCLA|nr:hypothetical protein L6452_27103 [Arctium lappa]